jgi:enterochelin esterase-like enzyme
MPFYLITILALFFIYGCSSNTIVIEKDKKIVEKKTIDENIIIQSQREPFTPIEFREYMKELDAKLFIDLDSKLFRGKDWVEYKQVQNTLESLIKQTREIKEFEVIRDDEEATRLIKKLITHEYLLDDVIKNEKFDYIKPAFNRVVESCNNCHDMMI